MLKYQIALINVWWSEEGIDTRYHNSVSEQRDYFSAKTSGLYSPLVNFIQNNAIETTVPYRDTSGRTPSELLKCNYAVIQQLDDTGVVVDERYYFAYPVQDSGTQMIVRLSLDDLQTNYFSQKDTIAPCTIRRAHLDRWGEVSDSNIKFNFDVTSPLFTREDARDLPKRLISMKPLQWKFTNKDEVNTWLNKNVAYWVYMFIDSTHKFTVRRIGGGTGTVSIGAGFLTYDGYIEYIAEYGVICYPVYKTSNKINLNIRGTYAGTYRVDPISASLFRSSNNDSSFIYNAKMSIYPPFRYFTDGVSDISFSEGGDMIISITPSSDPDISQFNVAGGYRASTRQYGSTMGILTSENTFLFSEVMQSALPLESYPVNITDPDMQLSYPVSSVVGGYASPNYNPKLLGAECITLRLKGFDGNYYDYDCAKLNSNSLIFLYNETMQPEITKYYCRVQAPSGLYVESTNLNYTGLVGSTDTSTALSNDQYQAFLANNKNFWLQSTFQILGGLNFDAKNGREILQQGREVASSLLDKVFTTDNLREAPDSLRNANGNALFNAQVNTFNFFVEILKPIDIDKLQYNDVMYKNGYAYNRVDSIANYDNIRHYFNYIEADVESISGKISNIEKERLRERLSAVRFWNTDTIQYTLENYERRLANGTIQEA